MYKLDDFLDNDAIKDIYNLFTNNKLITSLSISTPFGLYTTAAKKLYSFDQSSKLLDIIKQGTNSEVVFFGHGKIFYPVRIVFVKSSQMTRAKLSFYIPFKLMNYSQAKTKVNIIPVKSGTIFETNFSTTSVKTLNTLINNLIKEVKKFLLMYTEDPKILDKFDKDILN